MPVETVQGPAQDISVRKEKAISRKVVRIYFRIQKITHTHTHTQ